MAFLGKEIHRVYDADGPIQIFDDGIRRHLSFGTDDEQGCILKADPTQLQYAYSKAMMLGLLQCEDPNRCLFLGLGSGALAQVFFSRCLHTQIEVVELREQVVRLAYRFLQLPRSDRLHTTVGDANDYVKNPNNGPFDLIFSDIYTADGMDQSQQQDDYIDHCAQLLSPPGWLVLNFWDEHRNPALLAQLQTQFKQLWAARIDSGNWIVYASNVPTSQVLQPTKDALKALSLRLGFSLTKVLQNLVCLS